MYRHYEKSNDLPHRIISQLQQEKCTLNIALSILVIITVS